MVDVFTEFADGKAPFQIFLSVEMAFYGESLFLPLEVIP